MMHVGADVEALRDGNLDGKLNNKCQQMWQERQCDQLRENAAQA